jgi:hypothetical protein
MSRGTLANANIFFTQLNVPSRSFSSGFLATDGSLLTDNEGNPLLEWFGLQFETEIRLGQADSPGFYQFALLSDDGSMLELKTGTDSSGNTVLIDDNGAHTTKLVCEGGYVQLDSTTHVPVRIKYFQGPRFRIALILLWRKVGDHLTTFDSAGLNGPECGLSGENQFFDISTTPSTPTSHYTGLLGRGWKVLAPDNFVLPGEATNPCSD